MSARPGPGALRRQTGHGPGAAPMRVPGGGRALQRRGHGVAGVADPAPGGVGLAHRRLVLRPTPEHLLQLLPPLRLDLPAYLSFLALHGEALPPPVTPVSQREGGPVGIRDCASGAGVWREELLQSLGCVEDKQNSPFPWLGDLEHLTEFL